MRARRATAVILAIAWRNVYTTAKTPSLAAPPLLIPLFTLGLLGGGLSAVSQVPNFGFNGNYKAFAFIFVLAQASSMCGLFSAVALARDFETHFARRLLIAAPKRWQIVAGYALAALARALVTVPLLFFGGIVFGMTVNGSIGEVLGLAGLAMVMTVAAAFWAMGVALRLRTTQATPTMMMPIFAALFSAPAFLPLAALTGWLHAVASLNPLTPFIEAGRGLISGEPRFVGPALLTGAGLVTFFLMWTLTGLKKAEAAGG